MIMLDDDPTAMKWSNFDKKWHTSLIHLIRPTNLTLYHNFQKIPVHQVAVALDLE